MGNGYYNCSIDFDCFASEFIFPSSTFEIHWLFLANCQLPTANLISAAILPILHL
jgi:hypothetical protein